MIEVFYKKDGRIEVLQTVDAFAGLHLEDVVWIDMVSPEGEEKRAAFLCDGKPAPAAGQAAVTG